jgi:hypothetical protein
MTLARLLLALLFLLPVAAAAQAPAAAPTPAPSRAPFAVQMLAGSWVLRVEGTVMFRFDLAQDGAGWSGTWTKPRSFATDGAIFAELSGPPTEQRSQSGRAIGEDRAEMLYADTGHAPFALERVDAGTPPGPWADGRVYRRAGAQPGTLVSYNVGRRVAPSPEPTSVPAAPAATDRPPAVIGR